MRSGSRDVHVDAGEKEIPLTSSASPTAPGTSSGTITIRHPAHAFAEPQLGDPVRDVYVALDAAVGRLLAEAGPRTHTFVLCSHGMGACAGGNFLLDEVLRRLEGAPAPAKRRRALDPVLWIWQRLPWSLRSRLAPIRDPLACL